MSINKDKMAKLMGLELFGSYDCALPQPWLDGLTDKIVEHHIAYDSPIKREDVYTTLLSGIIWFYPKLPGYLFGYPMPLTPEAAEYLDKYHQ